MKNNYFEDLKRKWKDALIKPGTFLIYCILILLLYALTINIAGNYANDAFSRIPVDLSKDGTCDVDYVSVDVTDKNGISSRKCMYGKRVFLEDLQKLGPVGDSFAIATSLITTLTLVLVLLGYKLQYNFFDIQRQQLAEERNTSKHTQAELEKQNKAIRETMLQQTNDRQAFDWIELHHRMVERVVISLEPRGLYDKVNGIKGFQLLADVVLFEAARLLVGQKDPFAVKLSEENKAELNIFALNNPNKFTSAVEKFFEKHRHEHDSDLGHIFRNAYRLLKWIDEENSISVSKKWEYASIFRAQLSFSEIILFLLNAATEQSGKAAPLFSKYAMFENLPENSIYKIAYRQDQRFPASAFDADIAKEDMFGS